MNVTGVLAELLQGGLGNLAAYLAAHVLLCLVPAFYIAGAMTALIPKEPVTRLLGRSAARYVSYPAAAMAGSLLAVCSCTIVPLFAGIYRKGAGLGPAITFLFFAPAGNILALVYTGGVIGAELAFARLVLSLVFGIGIGLIMALIFRREDIAHEKAKDDAFSGGPQDGMRRSSLVFLLVLVALLLSGTLRIGIFTETYAELAVPLPGIDRFEEILDRLVPFDAAKGEEGVSAQGALLIALLALIGATSWKGMENIHAGLSRWTWAALALVGLTLLTAAAGLRPRPGGLDVLLSGRFFAVLLALAALGWLLRTRLGEAERRDFLWESWRFGKQIFPLLVVGVFAVGVVRELILPEWIEALAGTNSLQGNLAGVVFGVFMYFPTLVEVPIASMFLSLGMHRGPLLAYLMADPELSLQSILITATIIGRAKAWTYVFWVALFSTLAGLVYGSWVDGSSLPRIAASLGCFLAVLAAGLWWISRRNRALGAARPAATP